MLTSHFFCSFFIPIGCVLKVRCWEIMHSGAVVGSTPKASISHDQPVKLKCIAHSNSLAVAESTVEIIIILVDLSFFLKKM